MFARGCLFRCVLFLVVLVSFFSVDSARAGTLYYDSFNRTGNLNGSTPDTTWNSDTWVASSGSTDGSMCSVPASNFFAYLPFVPTGSDIYTLSADASLQNGTTGLWLGLGFLTDLNQGASWYNYSSPWILLRDNGKLQAFAGLGISNIVYNDDSGGQGGNPGQPNHLQVVLDTTQTEWTSKFYVNGVQLGSSFTYASHPAVVGVGIGNFISSGSFDNFSLSSPVPEPSTLALFGAGGIGLAAYAWRRRRAA
jgi:hypothetical protein